MRLRWLGLAAENLAAIAGYISKDNPAAATALIRRILACAERQTEHPGIGRVGRVEGTRELVIPGTPFIVVYRIHRNVVEALRVLHSRQRWP